MDDPSAAAIIILRILILFILIIINAYFSMSEIAIISVNDAKVEKDADDGNRKAIAVKKLTENSSNFFSTIQIGVTFAGFLASAFASQSFALILAKSFEDTVLERAVGKKTVETVATILITVLISYFSLVFGELVPKKLGTSNSEKIAYKVARFLNGFSKAVKPFVKLLSASTNGILRLLGIDPNADEETVTEEEIRMMVDVGRKKGVIEDSQKEMINNVFEFDDINVGDIMTHRTDVYFIDVDSSLKEAVSMAIESGHSRIPIFKDDQDNIIGVIYVKDLLKYIGLDLPKTKTVKDFMRKAFYVPETKKCGECFKEMTAEHIQLAVVIDEYGGTAGIITSEDIVEAIVGDIMDEYDSEENEVSKINDNTFILDGIAPIDEVAEELGVEFPEGDYDTIGGFVISLLGYIPENDKQSIVEYNNVKFTVLSVEDRRIEKIKVEILEKETDKGD